MFVNAGGRIVCDGKENYWKKSFLYAILAIRVKRQICIYFKGDI